MQEPEREELNPEGSLTTHLMGPEVNFRVTAVGQRQGRPRAGPRWRGEGVGGDGLCDPAAEAGSLRSWPSHMLKSYGGGHTLVVANTFFLPSNYDVKTEAKMKRGGR